LPVEEQDLARERRHAGCCLKRRQRAPGRVGSARPPVAAPVFVGRDPRLALGHRLPRAGRGDADDGDGQALAPLIDRAVHDQRVDRSRPQARRGTHEREAAAFGRHDLQRHATLDAAQRHARRAERGGLDRPAEAKGRRHVERDIERAVGRP
jgi:hypothetical protein